LAALTGSAPSAAGQWTGRLAGQPIHWLVTGAAGFIGSHLVETLLRHGQHVVGLDNFSTGFSHNLGDIRVRVGEEAWRRHRFVHGDITDLATCRDACNGVDVVLHQAALGSVPRSIADPLATHGANLTGFVNMLVAARDAGVRRFVYAASSSTYGDDAGLPKVEDRIGRPLSPYAVTKRANELYAEVFASCYHMQLVGLRYFNVFGSRQDPEGAYAAVIPRWIRALVRGEPVTIFGDGETSRDFCYVANAVQANVLAAVAVRQDPSSEVYNVAVGERTTLNALFLMLKALVAPQRPAAATVAATHAEFRAGDVRHSQADIERARRHLGFAPTHSVLDGLRECLPWYLTRFADNTAVPVGRGP
jgi:UDP-N-acetylglucosamine/UDP-N-acetylgalactosamine 4-epimerase